MTQTASQTNAKLLLICCAMISTMLIGCRSLENHFIYNPSVYPSGWNKIEDDTIEEVNFQAGDGTQLHGLFAPHPEPKAIILFAHGRKGNVTSTLENLSQFIDRHQVSVMVFDYRGFGRSQGLPDEDGLYMDARAARKWLADRTGVVENDIIVMGHSLGAAVAVELAAADGAGGLIVEGGFTSLPLLVRRYAPIIPADLMLTSKFDSIEKIKNYTGPTLIAHGADDRIIPIKHGRKLFEAAGGEKRFLRIDGAGHTAKPTKNYQRAIDDLIQQSNTR